MKKKYLYTSLFILFVATVGFVVIKYKKDQQSDKAAVYTLLPRKSKSGNDAEWMLAKKNIDNLMAKVKVNPADTKSLIALANAYIIESRISGNYTYYDKAAMKTVNDILATDQNNFEALALKALLFLSQHHFADGLATAKTAQQLNPYSAFVYGLLVDANVEMGNYDDAVAAADKMVATRPDLRSYSRIAYLREIYGDYPGAIDAMKMAVRAGAEGEESTEWCRIQLAHLYEHTGDISNATLQYKMALAERPGYAYSLSGLGRIAASEKKYDSAVNYYLQADALMDDFGIKEGLASVYKNTGKKEQSNSLYTDLINEMNSNAKMGNTDESIGHYADKELAYAYLQTGNYDKALEHALAEYNRRPKNIDANETMAWVYYKKQSYKEALQFIDAAFVTESKNPTLLCVAGLIYAKTGDVIKAKVMLQEGLANNPLISDDLRKESGETLQKLL